MTRTSFSGVLLRAIIGLLWCGLFGALLHRHYFVRTLDVRETVALERAREESFMGIFFGGERIGWVRSRFSGAGQGFVRLEQRAHLNLNVIDRLYPVDLEITAGLTEKFLLQDFQFQLNSPFYEMHASGEVDGRDVVFVMDTGKDRTTQRIRLEEEPYLSTGERRYLLEERLEPGERVRIPYFDPVTLTGKDSVIQYRGKEKVLVSGRVHNLHHFVETYSGIPISSWLDDEGHVIKEQSASGFVFVAEPEFQATRIVEKGTELLSGVSVPVTANFQDVKRLRKLTLHLKVPGETDFELNGGRQSYADGIVSVLREKLPPEGALPCENQDSVLASTVYVQAEHPLIKERSREIVKGVDGTMARVRSLTRWVFDNVEKRPVLGIPDAVTTLRTLTGDCNEHAALFAALARSEGIPTRIVSGVMFNENAFLYHAWNEVCVGEDWISIDATQDEMPADVGHVRFVVGEMEAQLRIGALIGRLGIEVVGYEESGNEGG